MERRSLPVGLATAGGFKGLTVAGSEEKLHLEPCSGLRRLRKVFRFAAPIARRAGACESGNEVRPREDEISGTPVTPDACGTCDSADSKRGDHHMCRAHGSHVDVVVQELLASDYGLYVWPSAILLAQYLWANADNFRGKVILELGSGTSLPGLLATKLGARVILSDSGKFAHTLENCRELLDLNRLSPSQCSVEDVSWGRLPHRLPSLSGHSIDVVMGADIFYDYQDYDDVCATIRFLLDFYASPNATVLICYQERGANPSILPLLRKWGLRSLPLLFEPQPHSVSVRAGDGSGSLQSPSDLSPHGSQSLQLCQLVGEDFQRDDPELMSNNLTSDSV